MSFPDFDEWNKRKKRIDARENVPHCKRGEVWLCNVGRNVGSEQSGSEVYKFARPVLVVRVMSPNTFWGLPITSANKEGKKDDHPFYYKIENVPELTGFVALSQLRLFDTKRLVRNIVRLEEKMTNKVSERIKELL